MGNITIKNVIMEKPNIYEEFPKGGVLGAVFIALALYGLGAYLMYQLGIASLVGYLIFCLLVEGHILWGSCRDCYYYGKWCGLGRGKLCGWLLPKGNPEKFGHKDVKWYHLLPDFLVFLIPLGIGIYLLVQGFSWVILGTMAGLVVLALGGNAVVRGRFACKYCAQREECPALKLFEKRKS